MSHFLLYYEMKNSVVKNSINLVHHVAILSYYERVIFVREVYEKHLEMRQLHHSTLSWISNPKEMEMWTWRIQPNDGPLMLSYRRKDVLVDVDAGARARAPNQNTQRNSNVEKDPFLQLLRFFWDFAEILLYRTENIKMMQVYFIIWIIIVLLLILVLMKKL